MLITTQRFKEHELHHLNYTKVHTFGTGNRKLKYYKGLHFPLLVKYQIIEKSKFYKHLIYYCNQFLLYTFLILLIFTVQNEKRRYFRYN